MIVVLSYYLQAQTGQYKADDVHENAYNYFHENSGLFDFSDYPKESRFYDPINMKLIGKMKDDVNGKIISEFVGLKSKIYYLITVYNEGITKSRRCQ